MSTDIEAATPTRRNTGKTARRRIKDGASLAGQSGRERLGKASGLARDLAINGRHHLSDAGHKTAAHARRRPLSTGLLVAGAVAGGALLLNPALRRLAIAAGPAVWKAVQKRRAAQA